MRDKAFLAADIIAVVLLTAVCAVLILSLSAARAVTERKAA
jgi:hypothetical protein